MDCVKCGTFEHSFLIKSPFSGRTAKEPWHKNIYVDKCTLPELKFLWSKGIKTSGICCGHGYLNPYVSVNKESIIKMLNLGYKNESLKKNHVFILKGIK